MAEEKKSEGKAEELSGNRPIPSQAEGDRETIEQDLAEKNNNQRGTASGK